MIFMLSMYAAASGQETELSGEKEAVKKVVETYLYAENAEETKRVLYPAARILSVDGSGKRIRESLISTPAKKRSGQRNLAPTQKIIAVEIAGDGASVKVATEFRNGSPLAATLQRHVQYLSLLKLNGEWKIVSILMPSAKFIDAVR